MNGELLGLAFAAGLVSALNPCGFAMLPAYLTFVVAGGGRSRTAAVGRAVAATAAMTAGFVAGFATFGLLTVAVATTLQRYLPILTVLIGAALILAGGWLLSGRHLGVVLPTLEAAPTRRLGSMFGYGLAYAAASLSCTIGPFLAVTAAAARTGATIDSVLIYLGYAAGFALVVGTLAVAAAFASAAVSARLRRVLPVVNRIGGALVLLTGVYIAYYGGYELRLFGGDASPEDAVITTAGRLQSAIAGWVHRHGALPWILVLAALAMIAAATAWRGRSNKN